MSTLLVLGGARSGKSRHAQAWAEQHSGPLAFVATAQAFDSEMEDRIARHQADRDARWQTWDAPLDLPQVLAQAAAGAGVVLVDCLTLWLSNCLLAGRDLDAAGAELCAAVQACPRPLALVANEVGFGIVPDNALARQFRDAAGRLNQQLAATVDDVVLVVAGLPMTLKSRTS